MITIVDYKAGNLTSVKRALNYLGIDCKVSGNPKEISCAEKLIFPGVGNAESAMQHLNESGIGYAITEAFSKSTPILGICLGSQIIFSSSEEGETCCLNIISGTVKKFIAPEDKAFKIPNMGWHDISIKRPHPLLSQLQASDEFYFVHSYYIAPSDERVVTATCDYITDFPAAVAYKNVAAVQFHPEKSGKAGLSILEKFSLWEGNEDA